MSEPLPESKLGTMPEPAEDPWRVAFVEFKTRDEKMVKDYQEEIDTLLVFAGLFSAVLTAFVVESYQSLQEDYNKTSADLLRHISHQLANSSFPAAPDSSKFQPQQSDVQVNVCWFVSLLLSLTVALFGIFMKQWMRTYMAWTDKTPHCTAVSLRQFRYRSLETWRLGAILTLLPTLLQISVILFLSGLLVFLCSLDRTVSNAMVVLTSVVFFVVAAVTILPAVARSCPYRSPLSEIIATPFWHVVDHAKMAASAVRAFIQSGWTYSPDSWPWISHVDHWQLDVLFKAVFPISWIQADLGMMFQYNSGGNRVSVHDGAMVHLCCTTQSQPLWSAAMTAIMAADFSDVESSDLDDEVWWPVAGCISLLHKEDLHPHPGRINALSFSARTSWALKRLSSSSKHRWFEFLLHFKTFIVESASKYVVESYLLCCIKSMEPSTRDQYMLALVEVLKVHILKLEEPQLDNIAWFFRVAESSNLWDLTSGAKFIEITKVLCRELQTTPSMTVGHCKLLHILGQFACQAAMLTTTEPHEHVLPDLKEILHALQHIDINISSSSHQSYGITNGCAPALIFVARHEPDLFPKPFARTIVHELQPVQLWNIACDTVGLDVEGIDVARIADADSGRRYLWESLNTRTPNATELFIAPPIFGRILDAYKTQGEQEGPSNMQL